MELLIWIGAGLTLLGVAGLMACVVLAMRAKKPGRPEEEVRQALQGVVLLNIGALGLSALGLMAVVFGVVLK